MERRRLSSTLLLLVAACLALVGCGSTGARSIATVSLRLDQTEARAGQPIKGVATVDNRTGHPVDLPDGSCDGWLFLGLSNGNIGATAANPLVGCAPFVLPVGVSRYPISVSTNVPSCSPGAADAPVNLPACLGPMHDMPPLPAGTYHTIGVCAAEGRELRQGPDYELHSLKHSLPFGAADFH